MKKIISTFFLALYLTSVFSTLLPYIDYLVNYDYISKVLCIDKDKVESTCKGKCHLNTQIEKVAKYKSPIEHSEKNPIVVTINDLQPAIVNNYELNFSSPLINLLTKYRHKNNYYTKDIFYSIFHPPQTV